MFILGAILIVDPEGLYGCKKGTRINS